MTFDRIRLCYAGLNIDIRNCFGQIKSIIRRHRCISSRFELPTITKEVFVLFKLPFRLNSCLVKWEGIKRINAIGVSNRF